MKNLILTLCITILLPVLTFSQSKELSKKTNDRNEFYLNIGKGVSNEGKLFGVGLNVIYPRNWGFSISYNHLRQIPEGLPEKYKDGSLVNNLNSFSFRVLKEFSTNTKLIRFGIEAGPSLISYNFADLSKINNNNSYSGSYSGTSGGGLFSGGLVNLGNLYTQSLYSTFGSSGSSGSRSNKKHKFKQETLGLSLRAKVEFPLASWIGLEIAAISNINKLQSYVGGEIHLTIGLVRGKM